MKIDQHVGIDDEGGGQVDGAAHAGRDAVREKAPHLVAKGQVFRAQQEVQGNSSYAISRPVAATFGSAIMVP
jgi:hypothetical protein